MDCSSITDFQQSTAIRIAKKFRNLHIGFIWCSYNIIQFFVLYAHRICLGVSSSAHLRISIWGRGGRYVLKIHFFIESGRKMIQFKTKSKIFIQKNIHSIESRIFNRIIHS